MNRRWRRRNYFIKKDFQGRYIFSFFVLVVAGSIFFTIIFSLLSSDTFTIVYKNYNLQIGKTPVILLMEILRAHWIFLVVGGFVVVVISMFLTHRIAGPLYKFEQSIHEMNRGNIGFDIHLRKNDEGKDLARMINQFNGLLSSRLKELREISDGIDSGLTQISGAIPDENSEASASLGRTRDLNRRLKEILQSYVIKNE